MSGELIVALVSLAVTALALIPPVLDQLRIIQMERLQAKADALMERARVAAFRDTNATGMLTEVPLVLSEDERPAARLLVRQEQAEFRGPDFFVIVDRTPLVSKFISKPKGWT